MSLSYSKQAYQYDNRLYLMDDMQQSSTEPKATTEEATDLPTLEKQMMWLSMQGQVVSSQKSRYGLQYFLAS